MQFSKFSLCDLMCTNNSHIVDMGMIKSLYKLYRYFKQLFLAQVILASPHLIPAELKLTIQDFMMSFLSTTTVEKVYKATMDRDYQDPQYTFLPYIQLLYLPELPCNEELHLLSLQTVLLSLQFNLGYDKFDHRKVLCEEGLEDYITFMPAHVPVSLQEQAKELVAIFGIFQPPTLENLAKARLAKTFNIDIQVPAMRLVRALSKLYKVGDT